MSPLSSAVSELSSVAWKGLVEGAWCDNIDVANFVHLNYQCYDGNEDFLVGPSPRTAQLIDEMKRLLRAERDAGGVLDIDTTRVSNVDAYEPGYMQRDSEVIVGLQTDEPLKRGVNVYGGLRMAMGSCQAYGRALDPALQEIFSSYRRTHNEGVFRAYDKDVLAARKWGIVTGLPDAYGRGRIIGDYRRIALYGTAQLIAAKKADHAAIHMEGVPTGEQIQLLEELSDQVDALNQLTAMAARYGDDIARPAENAREAVQWLCYGYLAAVKQQNGAAMSLGRTSTFIDIYIQRDLDNDVIDEQGAQELLANSGPPSMMSYLREILPG